MSRAPRDRHQYRDLVLSEHGPTTSAARLVAVALTVHMDKRTFETESSERLLATLTKLSERTVRTALGTLKAQGWIEERTKRRGRDYWLKIRRAAIPFGLAATVAGTQQQVAAAIAGTRLPANSAGLPANGEATAGKKLHGEPAMVADDPFPEIPIKNPGAATPLPAVAGSAAQRRCTRGDVRALEGAVDLEKRSERCDVNRAQAVDRLLRAGKSPEETARELGESLEFVRTRQRLRDLNPFRRGTQ